MWRSQVFRRHSKVSTVAESLVSADSPLQTGALLVRCSLRIRSYGSSLDIKVPSFGYRFNAVFSYCTFHVSDINTFTSNKIKSRLMGLLYFIIVVILGNAYLTSFFSCGQSSAVLRQCLSAYQQAVCKVSTHLSCLIFFMWNIAATSWLSPLFPSTVLPVSIYHSTRYPVTVPVGRLSGHFLLSGSGSSQNVEWHQMFNLLT